MRNLKRFLALALTMLMVIGSFSLSAKSFADTAEMTTEQVNALDVLSDLSIFIGKEDGTFGGAEEINRKEMAILASRIQTGEKFGASYGENVTPFSDVVSDFEAILYASNMGIVIGFEDGTFRPDDKVIYQDVLTMIVRTLGYKGAEMDAGYPSTYINKARELGITKGITSTVIPSWTSNVARQDVATLLYNALFAVKADGTTAAKFFGIDTYVVTAVEDYNLTGVTAYLANGTRVVVQPLNADGSINDMYYHIPVAAFEAAGLTPVHGASYRIASTDNMETVKSISALPSIELADDADMTAELYLDGTVVITGLDGKPVTYKAVERYTKVYNNQGTQKADNEIIVYNQRGFNWVTSGLYDIGKLPFNYFKPNQDKTAGLLTDANGNLLDKWGYVVAYFVPEWVSLKSVQIGVIEGEVEGTISGTGTSVDTNNNNATTNTTINGSINGELIGIYTGASGILYPYAVYDAATGTYAPATADDIAKAAQAQDNSTVYHVWTGDEVDSKGNFVKPYSSFVITNKDDKYTAVAYDDNADGKYDRLAFMYHSFAESNFTNAVTTGSVFGKGDHIYDGNAAANAFHTDSAVTPGELVRFYSDAARATVGRTYGQIPTLWAPIATIVEKYETTTVSGLVTAVNGTKMTIGGKAYDIATMALHNFKDMVPYGKDNATQYIGQNVTAVLYDGGIYSVKGSTNTWIIFEDYTGLTTNGYVTALAFSGSSEMKNITIASIDGYFFMYNNYNNPTHTSLGTVQTLYNKLQTGGFYAATKDAYGYYHIDSQAAANSVSGTANPRGNTDNNKWYKLTDNDPNGFTVTFKNGISTTKFNVMNPNLVGGFSGDAWLHEIKRIPTTNPWTKTEWEFIFFNPNTKTFTAGKGYPSDGSTLKYTHSSKMSSINEWMLWNGYYWDPQDTVYLCGSVIYMVAEFDGTIMSVTGNNGTTSTTQSDVVYLSAEAAANYTVDNVIPGLGGAGETLWGFRYVYNNSALSLSTGELVSICTDGIYNHRLEQGFYSVKNGVVDMKITDLSQPGCTLVTADITDITVDGFKLSEKAGSTYASEAIEMTYDLVAPKIFHLQYNPFRIESNADGYMSWNSFNSYWGRWGMTPTTTRVMYVDGIEKADTPVFIAISCPDGAIWEWVRVHLNLDNYNSRTYCDICNMAEDDGECPNCD